MNRMQARPLASTWLARRLGDQARGGGEPIPRAKLGRPSTPSSKCNIQVVAGSDRLKSNNTYWAPLDCAKTKYLVTKHTFVCQV